MQNAKTQLRIWLIFFGLSLFTIFLVTGCNSTPTVPIPPPEMTDVTPPGEDGRVLASGPAGTAGDGDVVLVFNEDQGQGAMIEAEEDGAFAVYVAANVGDELLIQVKRDNVLSREEVRIVPAAN